MIGRIALPLAAALLTSAAAAQQPPHPSVCRIVVDEGGGVAMGSGTLIDAQDRFGLVMTNWHVVRDAKGVIEVIFPDGFRSAARPVKLDETWDLAALVIWRPSATPVPLATAPPRPGDPLTICGYGRGNYRSAAGRCTDYYAPEIGLPHEMVELDVEARQGDSGGPIFNDRGELAGVLFGAGQGTTLGSFQGRVKDFLASVAPEVGAPQVAAAPPTGPRAVLDPPTLVRHDRFTNAPVVLDPPQAIAAAPERADAEPANAVLPVQRVATKPTRRTSLEASTAAAPPVGFTPTPRPPHRPSPPAPAGVATAAPAEGIDWVEDSRSLLALFGVGAIVIAFLRAGQ